MYQSIYVHMSFQSLENVATIGLVGRPSIDIWWDLGLTMWAWHGEGTFSV